MTRFPILLSSDFSPAMVLHPLAFRLTEKLTPLSTASITLPSGAAQVPLRSFVCLVSPNGTQAVYRVISSSETAGVETELTLQHSLCTLSDHMHPGEKEETSSCRVLLENLLSNQDLWRLGDVEVPDDEPLTWKGTNINDLQGLTDIMKELPGYYLDFSQDTTPWVLHVRKKPENIACEARMTRNLLEANLVYDTSEMCNVAYADGLEEPMTADTVSTWGSIERSVSADGDLPAEMLEKTVRRYLDVHKNPSITITLTALELSRLTGEPFDRFRLGMLCRCIIDGTEAVQRIEAIDWKDPLGAPADVVLTLASTQKDMSATVAGLVVDTRVRFDRMQKKLRLEAEQIEMLAKRIDVCAVDIAVNAVNIGVNAENIGINAKAIKANADLIQLNAGNVKLELDKINDTLTAQAGTINLIANDLNVAAENINVNADNIDINAKAIKANADLIQLNAGNVKLELDKINDTLTAQAGTINLIANDLNVAAENIAVNAANIDINAKKIAINATDITTNATNITTNATNITTNATNITTNATKIETNANRIDTNADAIAVNARNIAVNAESISAQAETIEAKADTVRVEAIETEITGLLKVENLQAAIANLSVLSNGSIQSDYVDTTDLVAQHASVSGSFSAGTAKIGGSSCGIATLTIGDKSCTFFAPADATFDLSDMPGYDDALAAARREGASSVTVSDIDLYDEQYGKTTKTISASLDVILSTNSTSQHSISVDASKAYNAGHSDGFLLGLKAARPVSASVSGSLSGDYGYSLDVTCTSEAGNTFGPFSVDFSAKEAYDKGYADGAASVRCDYVSFSYETAGSLYVFVYLTNGVGVTKSVDGY